MMKTSKSRTPTVMATVVHQSQASTCTEESFVSGSGGPAHRTGRLDHTILAGLELGRQVTDNLRHTGYFSSIGANVTSVMVPLSNPTTTLPLTFRQSATDADNRAVVNVSSAYVQDQITLCNRAAAAFRY